MLLALVLLIVWPVAEVFVAIKVAEAIGVLLTLLLLIASWPVGTWALRSQGRAAWVRLSDAVTAGRPPAREVIDGALVLIGGMLMIIPGFITDLLGITLLLAPTRALPRRLLLGTMRSRLVVRATGFARSPSAYDVESTATDVERHRLER